MQPCVFVVLPPMEVMLPYLYFVHSVLPNCFCLHCTALYQGCEREVAEASDGGSIERKNESIMRLSWALVHSRQPEDVKRGVAMLEG